VVRPGKQKKSNKEEETMDGILLKNIQQMPRIKNNRIQHGGGPIGTTLLDRGKSFKGRKGSSIYNTIRPRFLSELGHGKRGAGRYDSHLKWP